MVDILMFDIEGSEPALETRSIRSEKYRAAPFTVELPEWSLPIFFHWTGPGKPAIYH